MNSKDPRFQAAVVDSALGVRYIPEAELAAWSPQERQELAYYRSFSRLLGEAERYRIIPELGISTAEAEAQAGLEQNSEDGGEGLALAQDKKRKARVVEAWQRALALWEAESYTDEGDTKVKGESSHAWRESAGTNKKFWWRAVWISSTAALLFVVVGLGWWFGEDRASQFPHYQYPLEGKSLLVNNVDQILVRHYAFAGDTKSQNITLRLGFLLYHLEKLDRPLTPSEESSLYRLMAGIRSGHPEVWQSWRQRLFGWAQKRGRSSVQLLLGEMAQELRPSVAYMERGYRLAHTYYLLRKQISVKQAMELSGFVSSDSPSFKDLSYAPVVSEGMGRQKAMANIEKRFLR